MTTATLLRPAPLPSDSDISDGEADPEDLDDLLRRDDDDDPRPRPKPLQTFELAGVVLAAHVSPLPLLAPYACASFSLSGGPASFIPLLLLAGLMSWLSSALVIALQARYVGATSFPDLLAAAVVWTHRTPAAVLANGAVRALASLFVLAGSLLRTTMGLVASAELAVDLFSVHRRRGEDTAWDRSVAVGVIGAVWLLFPFLWSPILAVLGFRPSSGPTIPYTRLGTRSQADLVDLDSPPSASSSWSPLHESEWDWDRDASSPHNTGTGTGTGTRPSSPPPRWSALLNLPAWSVAVLVWPIALALFGFRLRHLNRHHHLPPPPPHRLNSSLAPFEGEGEMTSTASVGWWKATLLTFTMMMGASHETFQYVAALKRRRPTEEETCSLPPLALETTRRGRAFSSFAAEEEEGGVLDRLQGGGEGALSSARRRRRHQFPLAMALGLSGAFLVHLGWALVGTIGFAAAAAPGSPSEEADSTTQLISFPSPASERVAPPLLTTYRTQIPTGNILSDPRLLGTDTDPYLTAVRLLVLFATLTQLEGHAHVGLACLRRVFLPTRAGIFSFSTWRRRPPPLARPRDPSPSSSSPPNSQRNGIGGGGGSGGGGGDGATLTRVVARTGFYALVVLSGWATIARFSGREGPDGGGGGDGTGLVRLAEWSGIGIAGIGGCLVPALTYLILFHLRKPRLILLSSDPNPDPDASAPESFEHDELLERKEREMQRRLSGRRIGTDLGVFGLLGPVGVVLVARGLQAVLRVD